MFEDLIEIWSALQQSLKPMRLTRWQLAKLLAAQIHRDYPITVDLILLFLVSFFLFVVSRVTRPKGLSRVLGLPVLRGSRNRKDSLLNVVKEGKRKYSDAPYIIDASEDEYVVYPPALFDEVKRLTEKEASVQDFFRTISHGYAGVETDALYKTIAVDLARCVPLKVHSQQKDARIAYDLYVGYCPDHKNLPLFDTLMKVIGSVHASSFVGREVGTSDWPKMIQQLVMNVYLAVRILGWVPRLFKPVLKTLLFLPALKVERELRHMITPVVREDMDKYERAADRKEVLRPSENGKLPFTQWLMARYEPSQSTKYQLTTDNLLVNIGSTLKTAIAMYSIVLELAQRPQLQEELRREIEEITSMSNGQLPSTNLKELRKMDSVMRETARLSPFSLFTLHRQTRQPLQLSIGPLLPAGTTLCVDAHHINRSATMFPEPLAFDPFRFLNQRGKEAGTEHLFQFVSTGPSDPNWGDGIQACPGRFFANSTLKVCLIHLLMNYNIKLSQNQQHEEKEHMAYTPNGIFAPDVGVHVLFQSRN